MVEVKDGDAEKERVVERVMLGETVTLGDLEFSTIEKERSRLLPASVAKRMPLGARATPVAPWKSALEPTPSA